MARITAGDEIGDSGVLVPTLHNFFWIVDDDWGYTTAPAGSTHAGIETPTMLNRPSAWRRYHANFAMPAGGTHFTALEALVPQMAQAVGKNIIPVIIQSSAGPAFPIISKTDGKGNTAASTNTDTVGGHKGVARITAGEFDTAYTNLFTKIKNAMGGQPWAVDFWQEQAIPAQNIYGGYQGGITGAGQAAGAAAAVHLKSLLLAVDPTAIFMQCMTEFDPDNNKLSYWWGDGVPHVLATANYRDSMARLQATHDFSVTKNVPFMHFAGGFTQGKSVTCFDGVKRDKDGSVTGKSLISEMLAFADGGTVDNLCGLSVWNNDGGSGNDNHIDTSAASLAQYKALTASSKMQSFYIPGAVSAPPANVSLPTLTPQAADTTSTLTADPGDWTNSPTGYTYSYQKRQQSTGTVSSVTGSSSTLSASALSGYQARVGIVAANGSGNSGSPVYSEWTDVVSSSPANGVTGKLSFPVEGGLVANSTSPVAAYDCTGPKGISAVSFTLDGGSPIAGISPGGNGNGKWTAPVPVSGTIGTNHRITAVCTPVT